MKFSVTYTRCDGTRVENQIYTVDAISNAIKNLIEWGATEIVIVSIEEVVR